MKKANLIVWIGRFRSKTGYGKVTRDFYYGLTKLIDKNNLNLKIVGIDSGSGATIDSDNLLSYSENKDRFRYTVNGEYNVYVVCHEVANYWRKLDLTGRIRFSGYTVHEFLAQIKEDKDALTLPHELIVPSEWNRKLLIHELKLAEDYVYKIPHLYNEMDENLSVENNFEKFNEMSEALDGSIKFLLVISNLERKNASLAITAFIEEFSNNKNVSLIVKIPNSTSLDDLNNKLLPLPISYINKDAPDIYFIKDTLTDSEINYLREISYCNINVESSKGFDLDSFEFLLSKKQVVATNIGGSTEYMNSKNTYQVELDSVEFYGVHNYNNERNYKNIVTESPSIGAIRQELRNVYRDYENKIEKNNLYESKKIKKDFSSERVCSKLIELLLKSKEDHDFVSLHDPKIIINKTKVYNKKIFPFQALSVEEINNINLSFKSPKNFTNKDEWLQDRRTLFGKYGGVPPLSTELDKLKSMEDKYKGKRCFIIGNGPSINKTNLELLKNEFTFCSNKFYLKIPDLSWTPTFYTALDWRVTPDDSDHLQEFFDSQPNIIKFIPNRFKKLFNEDKNMFWYFSIPGGKYLSEKIEKNALLGVRGAGTVSTAMIQLAIFMGFKDIYLIGTDVTYKIPESVKQEGEDKFNTGTKINLLSTQNDDPNHFSDNYFGKGARWHDPNVPEMKRGFRVSYLAAKTYNVNIFNATVGGALDCIPRVEYDSLFRK